jgi:GDPmannose 4,6-dehydratase
VSSGSHVLIVGDQGQDGRILAEFLTRKGFGIVGLDRDALRVNGDVIDSKVTLMDYDALSAVIQTYKPKQIYYLAAFHQSAEVRDALAADRMSYMHSQNVHVIGLVNILYAVQQYQPSARIFYAASSLVFGEDAVEVKTEQSPFNPTCVYGMTKAQGLWVCQEFRRRYGLFASGGILYNHDSVYRQDQFLTAKIIKHAIGVATGERSHAVEVGDLGVSIDLGYAPDYVRAFHEILNFHSAEDFIVATGSMNTVEEFVEQVFDYFGVRWQDYVKVNPALLPKKPVPRIGSPRKLNEYAGISVSRPFAEIVQFLIRDHLTLRGIRMSN